MFLTVVVAVLLLLWSMARKILCVCQGLISMGARFSAGHKVGNKFPPVMVDIAVGVGNRDSGSHEGRPQVGTG